MDGYNGAEGEVVLLVSLDSHADARPRIWQQPSNQTVYTGSNGWFTVTVAGLPPLTYQWWFNGAAIGAATNSLLTLTNVQAKDAGVYFVKVGNLIGSVLSSNAVLTVVESVPIVPPLLNALANVIGGTLDLTLQGVVGKFYRIEASSNLLDWTSMMMTNATGTNYFLRDSLPRAAAKRFYRAVQE